MFRHRNWSLSVFRVAGVSAFVWSMHMASKGDREKKRDLFTWNAIHLTSSRQSTQKKSVLSDVLRRKSNTYPILEIRKYCYRFLNNRLAT